MTPRPNAPSSSSDAGPIPLDLLKSEQDRITIEIATAEDWLAAVDLAFETVAINLGKAVGFVTDIHAADVSAGATIRRQL